MNRIFSSLPMAIFTCLLAFTGASSAQAQPGTYRFQPAAGQANACRKAGMVGQFAFQVKSSDPRLGYMTFSQTKRQLVLLRDGSSRWIMSIQGSWSEHIRLDFAEGTFSFQSSRPGKSGHCEGRVR